LTLCVNQSLAKTAAGVNYPSARLPRLIQIVAPFSSRLSRDSSGEFAAPKRRPPLRVMTLKQEIVSAQAHSAAPT
jgi:hypothetical protein